ncbi:MAG: cob(I)yrinic acid a,c-diamide adenosyltransferase [Dethiosulfovibrio peptidovorans]|nr:MAG: cob(I)yrinic acid a,c-diamide adenosyltransferase [Dethiosulfovibrio peptidovorans]
MERGYITVNTGDGKGKTTAAIGQALRALGAGFSVYVGQFLKSRNSGEIDALQIFAPRVVTELYGAQRQIGSPMTERDRHMAQAGMLRLSDALYQGYDLVVADEILVALSKGLLSEGQVLDLIHRKPESVELILTGRGAPPSVMGAADVVTEMRAIQHHYRDGVLARVGIER